MPFLGNKMLILISMLILYCNGLSIDMITASNSSVNLYSNGQYNTQFILQATTFNCSINEIYTYQQTPQQNHNNSPYTLSFTNLSQNVVFNLKPKFSKINPVLSSTSCAAGNTCTVTVYNNCPVDVGQFSYFDIFVLQVQGLSTPFSYNVLCDNTFSTNTFQWGLIIMMVFCLILEALIAIYSRAWSMGGAGIKLNYWIVIAFWVAVIIAGIIAQFAPNAIQTVLQVFILIMGILGIWICSNQLIFLLKIKALQTGIQITQEFKIKILDIIGLFIGIGFVIAYYFSGKNWILNDVICVCMIVATIKIMKFTDLKITIFALLVGLAVEMAFVQTIHYGKLISYNLLILNNYNFPFQLQLPTINPVYKQKCAWFAFTTVIYPGIFMSYLRRFDLSRNTNIYLITAIGCYIFGSVIWMLISVGSVHSWPFQIVAGPVSISLVSIFAYRRRQIRTLWEGSFYDVDFANRDGLDQILNVVNKQSTPNDLTNNEDIQLIRGSILSSLKINRREDSDMTIIKKFSNMSNQLQSSSMEKQSVKSAKS